MIKKKIVLYLCQNAMQIIKTKLIKDNDEKH